jgi:demethylmenaquinone methyltransferase/2-methoxy-6-polyprenyl-1,4-benzoquinol methylase
VTGLDQSEAMLEIARSRCPGATFVHGDALELPFSSGSFDLVVTKHFYGHLRPEDRLRFLGEARRVAPSLLVVDSALRAQVEPEQVQERVLEDGTRHEVYKRYFDPDALAAELGGGEVLFASAWFAAVQA